MQIEEAIEKLKETAKQCRNSKECWENEDCCDCYVEVEDIFAIETVLNELEKKDTVIDLIAEQLAGLAIFDITKEEPLILGDKEEVKQYFYKKAEEK